MASYDSYNWDGDEKWKEYLQNVTVPASGNEQQMMDRLRKRYFKKNINPDYDEGGSQQQQQQTAPPQQSSPPPQRPPQQQQQQQQQPQQQSQQRPQQQQQMFNFDNIFLIANIYLIVNAILFVIPMTSAEFSYNCYRRALYSGCVAYGTSLYRSFASGPNRGARVKDYVYYLLYCAAVLNATPSMIYVVPLTICSFFMVGETILQLSSRISILSLFGVLIRRYTELLAFAISVFHCITGSASLIVVLTLWQFVTYRYQTSGPSTQMVDMYSQRIGSLFQHRFVPSMVQRSYANLKGFFSNYAQSR